MNLSPYFILALDSAFASAASLLGMVNFSYLAFGFEPGILSCSCIVLTSAIVAFIQPVLSFLLSLIRFKRMTLNNPHGWAPEPILITASQLILFLSLCYNILILLFNAIFDLKISIAYNFCMKTTEPNHANLGLLTVFIFLPMLAITIATALMDIKCYLFIQQHRQNNTNTIHDEISFRASIISSLFVVPYFVFPGIINNIPAIISEIQTQVFWLIFLQHLLILTRNPLISTLAFRINELNSRVDADQDRQQRQEFERQEALKARNERRNANSNMLPPVEC